MSSPLADPIAVRAWADRQKLWVQLADGRVLGVPLVFFPRLMHADDLERNRVEFSAEGRGLHWDHLDEDISVAQLLAGEVDRTRSSRQHLETCWECRSSARPDR